MPPVKILVIDDEEEIIELLELYLKKDGFLIFRAVNGRSGIATAVREKPDLIVLDIVLPDMNGFDVCQQFHSLGLDMPIIFLSCRNEEEHKVTGLALGDDYVTKPFSLGELKARIEARLRNRLGTADDARSRQLIRCGDLEIDLLAHSVRANNTEIPVSVTEFQILSLLARHPHRVFSPEQLYELIWQTQGLDDIRTVMVHISNLRKKLEKLSQNRQYIITVRGIGYKISDSL